eukprot:2533640-Pyramimonas_sp.AAC.1
MLMLRRTTTMMMEMTTTTPTAITMTMTKLRMRMSSPRGPRKSQRSLQGSPRMPLETAQHFISP